MSTHYMIDAHTNPIANSEINDVRLSTVASEINGNFIVRVPSDIRLASTPTSLNDLLAKKIAGIQERYAGFGVAGSPQIEFSHMLDGTDVVLPSNTGFNRVYIGERYGCWFEGTFSTTTRTIGPSVNTVIVLVEFFNKSLSDPKDGLTTLTYTDLVHDGASDPAQVDISLDNGANYLTSISLGVPITTSNGGNQLSLRFDRNIGGLPTGISFWAILY